VAGHEAAGKALVQEVDIRRCVDDEIGGITKVRADHAVELRFGMSMETACMPPGEADASS
jgi:hypothetical protein